MGSAVFQNLLNESNQAHALRKTLLKTIGEKYNRHAISFFTSFSSTKGTISDPDTEILRDLLVGAGDLDKKILLIIDSPGGYPLAAERFIKICREFSDNDYWVMVPGKAKSAATMISLGASRLIMTPTSELGPVDIQVPWGDELVPAQVIIDAYDELMERGMELPENQRLEPILQQLQQFSAPNINQLRLTKDLSKDIAQKVLREGMFKEASDDELDELLRIFVNPGELKDHGRPIFFSDLKDIDKNERLEIDLISPSDELYSVIHEYYMRVIFYMGSNFAKVLESEDSAFSIPA